MASHSNQWFRRIWRNSIRVCRFHAPLPKIQAHFRYSYDTGTISGILAMPYWDKTFSTGFRDSDGNLSVTSSQSSAIVSILSAGTFFGALSAAPMGDVIGRRWGLIASTGVFTIGVAFQTAATAIPLFLAGRFFAGFGVGLISALSE